MQVLPYIMRQIHYTNETKMAGRTLELLDDGERAGGSRWGRRLVDFLVSLVGLKF